MEGNILKRIVVMFCGSNMYDSINADREIAAVKDISLANPIKYVYDPEVRIFYEIIKNTPEMDEKFGDNDIVIVNSSQFGDEGIREEDMLASIARITNFSDNVTTKEEVIEHVEGDIVGIED